MSTLRQLHKNPRKRIKRRSRTLSLKNCPQKRGIVSRLYRVKPKKPNSAQRKVAKIKLCTNKTLLVYLPGMNFGLFPQIFANALIRGGRVRDLPGIRYKLIRGKYDISSILHRRQARSKYGVRNQDNYAKRVKEYVQTIMPTAQNIENFPDFVLNRNPITNEMEPFIFLAKTRKMVDKMVAKFKEEQERKKKAKEQEEQQNGETINSETVNAEEIKI